MRLNFCVVCGSTEDLHHHHCIPKFYGGSDDDTNMITLCTKHHKQIHSQKYKDSINHSNLTKEGLQRAKERGVKLGNPNIIEMNKTVKRKARIFAYEYQDEVLDLKNKGFSNRQICKKFMEKKYKTPQGSSIWHSMNISRIIARSQNKDL